MKKKAHRLLSLFLAAAMAVLLLAGCSGKEPTPAASGGSGTAASGSPDAEAPTGIIEGEAATGMIDKIVVQSGAASDDPSPFSPPVGGVVRTRLYGKLIVRNHYGALLEDCTMWLAKSVTKVDDFTYDIELYDYITDSKGNNIDADDVIFSYKMSFELGKFLRVGSAIESLEKTGDYTLRMKLNTKAPGVLEDLLSNVLLDIVDQEWYENASEEERRKDPATTGAYKVVSEVAGSSIVIEAVEDYWQKDPSLRNVYDQQTVKTIEYKVITEASMAAIALENKEVDAATFNDNTNLARFVEGGQPKDGYNVVFGESVYTMDAFLNMSDESILSKNPDLRKAVLYALNSEDIMYAAGFDENTSIVLKTLGTPSMAGFQPEWENEDYYDYNVETAADYLKKAGYAPGEVTLTLLTSSILANDSVRAVMLNNLEEAGFKVELVTVDAAVFTNYRTDPTQWDVLLEFKSASTGHISGLWDGNFNPSSFVDGTSTCLARDDELVRLMEAVNDDPSTENLNAFHYYLKEQAYCKGLYSMRGGCVTSDKVLEITKDSLGAMVPNAMVFAADFESCK